MIWTLMIHGGAGRLTPETLTPEQHAGCLLYTSDAADD